MAEPMPKPLFDALVAAAGVALSPGEAERIRAVSRHVLTYVEILRAPDPCRTDPAVTFRAAGAGQ
jgi:hypothetical protein